MAIVSVVNGESLEHEWEPNQRIVLGVGVRRNFEVFRWWHPILGAEDVCGKTGVGAGGENVTSKSLTAGMDSDSWQAPRRHTVITEPVHDRGIPRGCGTREKFPFPHY